MGLDRRDSLVPLAGGAGAGVGVAIPSLFPVSGGTALGAAVVAGAVASSVILYALTVLVE